MARNTPTKPNKPKAQSKSVPKGFNGMHILGLLFNTIGGYGFVIVAGTYFLFQMPNGLQEAFFKKWFLLEEGDSIFSYIIIIFLLVGCFIMCMIFNARLKLMQERLDQMADEKRKLQEILSGRDFNSSNPI